ncbi:LysR family transcriptional regulator [Salmonella enterica subsp. enterica serovar Choleraesuis]|nr:LysR family transcriptional regulator [Salmonella enterica subsp. enterica serovar Choleraesuis]
MQLNNEITFRKLAIFVAFMERGNIGRTAEALGMSSVSVHRALHTLEESICCPLFVHQGRNLIPQPAAHTLAEHARELLKMMENGLEETRKVAGLGGGRLRIGTLYSLTLETVPRLVMGMKLRRPELELDLTMGSNLALLTMLEQNKLDALLISASGSEIDTAKLEMLPLFDDRICLAAPVSAGLDTSQPADLRQFRHQRFVSLAEGFATYAGFKEAFDIAGFEPQIAMRVNDIFSMLSLVQAGVGMTLMPERMKKVYEHDVQLLPLAEPYQMRQRIVLVFPRNRERDPNLLALAAEGRMYARNQQAGAKISG